MFRRMARIPEQRSEVSRAGRRTTVQPRCSDTLALFAAYVSFLLLPLARLGSAELLLAAASLLLNFNPPIFNVNAVTI
jgi:hypothetical protein